MIKTKKRNICVAVFSRANYGSIRKVLMVLKKSKKVNLQILTGGSANIGKYGLVSEVIKKDNFKVDEDIYFLVQKLDNLSLQKKRQLTIPLIKEIL